jgi:hypothetical protein
MRIHAAGADNTKPACITNGAGQPPAAGPYHAGLDDGVLNIEKLSDPVLHVRFSYELRVTGLILIKHH